MHTRLPSHSSSHRQEVRRLPEFVDSAVKEIDDRLRALKDEASRLEAARAALTGGRRSSSRAVANGTGRPRAQSANRRNGRTSAPRARRGGSTRANQALELVRKQPGITIPEIAKSMKIQPNYLYRVLPRLASDGEITRDGQGWHAHGSSTPARTTRTGSAPSRSRTRAAKSGPKASSTRTVRTRRSTQRGAQSPSRTARGATRTAILAVLAGGEPMTAGQVATQAGLGRATVSTTLSKLAKSGEVQKATRGYQVTGTR